MFRQVIRRAFCVNNNDPIHARNYQNDHKRGLYEKFREQDSSQILGNFQQKFHDPQYLEKSEVILFAKTDRNENFEDFVRKRIPSET